jgi:hypothetical protein
MSDDQFTKLFKYMEEFRADVNRRFDENARDHADIRGAISELSAQVRGRLNERNEIVVTAPVGSLLVTELIGLVSFDGPLLKK